LEDLYRDGFTHAAIALSSILREDQLQPEPFTKALILRGMALFDAGRVVEAIQGLEAAVEASTVTSLRVQFDAAFALFMRATDFQSPDETLPGLTRLRQLATRVGDAYALGALHLAVARIEGLRGHCIDAHRHLEIARRLSDQQTNEALGCSVDLVESSLELVAGNLARCRLVVGDCLEHAESSGLSRYKVGALSNFGLVSLFSGNALLARKSFEEVLRQSAEITYVRLGALDSLAQLALFEQDTVACKKFLRACGELSALEILPSHSWYQLYHQLTRCAYYERTEEWRRILEISDEAEPELARRQYKALRTALLCAKARALARLAKFTEADRAIAGAVRACPRGGVDPLIVLEATRAICLGLAGETARAGVHFDRAIAGCHAIGHRYHEAWIAGTRTEIMSTVRSRVAVRRERDVADTALVLTDVGAILGAGHSIDLLTHRVTAILQSTPLAPRVTVENESGCEFQAQPNAVTETTADGTFAMTLRGSDRRAIVRVRGVENLDEVAMLKGLSDLVQAAVNRAADNESEDEEQNLWPRTTQAGPDEVIFRSPRMAELLKIAMRLAETPLPVLITGETGTGKEILARIIHDASRVKRGPFIPFNCAATPRDLVESQLFGHRRGAFTGAMDAFPGIIRSAEHGTLFLDEIGDLDHAVQPKLLRFLESGEIHTVGESRPHQVTVRVIAATNVDITREVQDGGFRRDLFYRIGAAPLHLPPLRERKDEIPALAALFLARYAREFGRTGLRLGDDFIAALLLYDWPGNIRELANEVRRVIAMADDGATLDSTSLAPDILQRWNERPVQATPSAGPMIHVRLDQTLAQAVRQLEEQFIDHALETTGGRVTEAAGILGLSRKGLFLKRRRRGLVGGRPDVLP
jgi:DNA-binding NtrC family response regulator